MSEKSIFNDMNNESALKTLSREMHEIKWVTRKTICALGLPSDPKEIMHNNKTQQKNNSKKVLILKSSCY